MQKAARLLLPDDKKIEEIIIAFGTYALGDIEANVKERPIAAFILASCLIDQLATFRYNIDENGNHAHYYREFIKKYLDKYNAMQLYHSLRCSLVHNYSIDEHIGIATEDYILDSNLSLINANTITTKTFFKDLQAAWENYKTELLTLSSITRKNALLRFDISPTLIETKTMIWVYDKKEADFLINFYQSNMKGKFINNNPQLVITYIIRELIKEGEYAGKYILNVIAKKSKTKKYSAYLDTVTQQLNLIYPIEALKQMK